MKSLFAIVIVIATLSVSAQTAPEAGGCAGCTPKPAAEALSTQTIPGTNETMLVGRIENLMPIGIVAVLGCETCAAETVKWALQQGSSIDDVERALRTVEAMQKLDCFKQRFGADAAARLEKPLAAARKVLQQAQQASDHPGK